VFTALLEFLAIRFLGFQYSPNLHCRYIGDVKYIKAQCLLISKKIDYFEENMSQLDPLCLMSSLQICQRNLETIFLSIHVGFRP